MQLIHFIPTVEWTEGQMKAIWKLQELVREGMLVPVPTIAGLLHIVTRSRKKTMNTLKQDG